MVWWNIGSLIQALHGNKIDEHGQKNYLLFSLLLLTIVPFIKVSSVLEAFVTTLILIFGVNLCYAMNLKHNKDFILRFISLSVPIGIRVILIRFIIGIIEIAILASRFLVPYKKIRSIPVKYVVQFVVQLPAKIIALMYNPPVELGTVWLIFHRLIPLTLQLLFFTWIAFAIRAIGQRKRNAQ